MYGKALPLCYKMQRCDRAKSSSSVTLCHLFVHGVTCTLSSSYKHFFTRSRSKVEHSLSVSIYNLIVEHFLAVNVSTQYTMSHACIPTPHTTYQLHVPTPRTTYQLQVPTPRTMYHLHVTRTNSTYHVPTPRTNSTNTHQLRVPTPRNVY